LIILLTRLSMFFQKRFVFLRVKHSQIFLSLIWWKYRACVPFFVLFENMYRISCNSFDTDTTKTWFQAPCMVVSLLVIYLIFFWIFKLYLYHYHHYSMHFYILIYAGLSFFQLLSNYMYFKRGPMDLKRLEALWNWSWATLSLLIKWNKKNTRHYEAFRFLLDVGI
jgi:hypothetical protein